MTSCCPPPRTRWSGAIGAIARGKRVSIACGRASRSVPVLRWICGVKPTPKAVNKPLHHFIVHGLAKPGALATVSKNPGKHPQNAHEMPVLVDNGNCYSREQRMADDTVKAFYSIR